MKPFDYWGSVNVVPSLLHPHNEDENMAIRDLFCLCLIGLTVSGASTSGRTQTLDAIEPSSELGSTNTPLHQVAYIKASNTRAGDQFGAGGTLLGDAVALSADGSTLAVGAPFESSGSTGLDGNQDDGSIYGAGAVYIFTRDGQNWVQQAYVKASNSGLGDNFGFAVVLSADGDTLA